MNLPLPAVGVSERLKTEHRITLPGDNKTSHLKTRRPLQNPTFYPISASYSNFNPQNTQCIPAFPVGPADRTGVVKIFVFLALDQKSAFFKGLNRLCKYFWCSPTNFYLRISSKSLDIGESYPHRTPPIARVPGASSLVIGSSDLSTSVNRMGQAHHAD